MPTASLAAFLWVGIVTDGGEGGLPTGSKTGSELGVELGVDPRNRQSHTPRSLFRFMVVSCTIPKKIQAKNIGGRLENEI